jgi:UDP-GlcNAc:undecaprenyl-phosphate GlcNAc-1-phosphate transferase
MTSLELTLSALLMIVIEWAYFGVARRFGIVDRPNDRSLHAQPTIRGGGVIFFVAICLYCFFSKELNLMFLLTLTLVSVVGFLDDALNMNSSVRLAVQTVSFMLLFYNLGIQTMYGLPVMAVFIFLGVAALNAYNFMDGVNGMTGGYTLVVLGSLFYVNGFQPFIGADLFLIVLFSLLVFLFCNFRNRALCFAGDVGSTSIAFILIYMISMAIIVTGNFIFILFLSVYGVDAALTIAHRILRKENIFKAHRLHLYQVIVHHYKIPHLVISGMYMVLQLIVNAMIVVNLPQQPGYQYLIGGLIVVALSAAYIVIKALLLARVRSV